MVISDLRWWHIPEVLTIEADLFGVERWSAAMFWNELAHGHRYRVALDDGHVVGYAGLAVAGSDEATVQNIAVRRDRQRQGIGEALLKDILTEADRRGVRRTILEVAVDNEPAQHLYRRYGFTPAGIRRGYYQPTNTDALTMVRTAATADGRGNGAGQ